VVGYASPQLICFAEALDSIVHACDQAAQFTVSSGMYVLYEYALSDADFGTNRLNITAGVNYRANTGYYASASSTWTDSITITEVAPRSWTDFRVC